MIVKLLMEHHLEFLSLKGGCRGSFESTRENTTLFEITCQGSYKKEIGVFPLTEKLAGAFIEINMVSTYFFIILIFDEYRSLQV